MVPQPSSRSSNIMRAEQAPPPPSTNNRSYYSSTGRSNNRMILEQQLAESQSFSSAATGATGTTGAASRRRNMAFLKYGSEGMPKRSASKLQKSREHARQIANITPIHWDNTTNSMMTTSPPRGGSGGTAGTLDMFSDDFMLAKIHKAEAALTAANPSSFATNTTSSATAIGGGSSHHKKSSSSRREKSKSSRKTRNHDVFPSTDVSFADFGAAFATSSTSQRQSPPPPQQQPQHQYQNRAMISDVDSSIYSEASSSLSFFAEDLFANVRSNTNDAFTTTSATTTSSISNNLQTLSQQQQQQQQQRISNSRRGGNSTRAAQNTRENKNHLDNAFSTATTTSRQQQQATVQQQPVATSTLSSHRRRQEEQPTMMQKDWSSHSAPPETTRRTQQQPLHSGWEMVSSPSPRTKQKMSMSTMPSNSSMQRAFVNQQQHHHAQHPQHQPEITASGSMTSNNSMGSNSGGAMARRKMRSQQKGTSNSSGSGGFHRSESEPFVVRSNSIGSNRTPPHSPYSQVNNNNDIHKRHPSSSSAESSTLHYSMQPKQRQQQQGIISTTNRSVSSNNTGRSDSTATTPNAGGSGVGGGGGSTTSNGSGVDLFSHGHAASAGFTFDAFGLDASQMNAQVNQAMHELAGSHPDLSFFVDDDFGSSAGGGQQQWDYSSQSPTISRSSTPPPPGQQPHINNKHGTISNNSVGSENNDTDLDDEEGFVDGFRITKQSHLPVHIRNSPCSTERSSLTSESSANNVNNVNVFKEQAAFHTSKRPRKFVRPSERVDDATSPKSKQSLGSPQRHAHLHHKNDAAYHFQRQSSSSSSIQKRQDSFQKPSQLPSMPDLDNNRNSNRSMTMTRGTINNDVESRHRPRREDVQFVDVNSDSDFSAGGGSGVNNNNNDKTGPKTTTAGYNSSPVRAAARGKDPSDTVSAASRMTARMSSSSSPVRTVASLRLNAVTAAALLPNQQRKPQHPSSLEEEEDERYQIREQQEIYKKTVDASNRARSEVNVSVTSKSAYSNVNAAAAASRRAYSDVNAAANSDINAAVSDVGGSNIPSDVGLASDVGPPLSSVGAAFENIPKEVVSRERQLKKGSADTATTETSSLMPYEEKKEEEPLTPSTPEKSVGSLRARWEKQESAGVDRPSPPPFFQVQQQYQRNQQQQPPGPSPLNREHIEKLQNQLREENMSPQLAVQQQKPTLSYTPGSKSPHIRRAEDHAQQQQQPWMSPRQNRSPSSPQQRNGMKTAAPKSEGGAAHTRFRPAHINAAINRIQSPQSSIGTPRDAKSDTGAPSPSFFKVQLRKTGNVPKESPAINNNDPSTSSYKPPLSPKTSYQYSKQSPPPSPKTPYQYSRQQAPVSPANSRSSRTESPHPASPQAEGPPERKMTYRERRELELQQKRDEELRQQENQQANDPPELDVASLIKRRIAANKKTGDTSLSSPRDLPPRRQPMQISSPRQPSSAELPPKPYSRQNSQRELSTEALSREPSPDRYASETRQYSRNEMKDSLSKILTAQQSTGPQRSRNSGLDHSDTSDSRDLSIEDVGPTETESTEPSAAISRLLMLQQLQARIPAEPTSTGRQTDASSRQDSEDHHHRSSTPKATKMMLNAFLAGRDSIASADGTSHADAIGEGYSDEKSAGPLSTLPALKDDPQYERYFKMLKLGMPMEVVKHAMIRDGLDPAIMDGDPNKPVMVGIPLKEDPTYQKYFKMLKIGMPMEAVKHAMLRDGLDCSVMDQDHNIPLQKAKSEDDQDEPKEKDSHRRARLHWKTLRKVTSNSLWAKLDQEVSFQDIHIDEDEFQQLFQAERGEPPAPKASSTAVGGRGVHVRVIDPKRANNGGIILARLKMSHDDMADAVDRINEQALTAEQIEHIIEFLPSKEERKALESYMLEGGQDAAEKFDGLCECEKFMVSMMTVKHAKRKVRALLFKLQFENCLDDILQDTLAVEAACDELSNSVRLRQLLGIILTFGNRLNTAGNKKRRAGAFTLDSLLKLNQAKAFDKKTTFLHYIILIVQRNNELLLRFKDDLPTVFKADKVFWDQCLSDLEEVESQLENVRKIALHQARQSHCYRLRRRKQRDDDGSESLSDDEVSLSLEEEVEALRATPIGTFTLNAIKYASSLRDKVEETQGKLSRLLEYFGEEDKNMASHELFSIIVNFSRDFDKAKEQVFSNEKKKMREERKYKSNHGKPPTHSPGPPGERKMLMASSHQPSISGVLRAQQRTSYAAEIPADVMKKIDPYSYRSSGVDSSQLPVIEDDNYNSYNHHPNRIMESSSQVSTPSEDDNRFLDAPGEQHIPIPDDRYIVSDQQQRFQSSSTSEEDRGNAQFDEEIVRPPEMSSNEDFDPVQMDVEQEERNSSTPERTRPGPDAPLTPTGYHRVETPKPSRNGYAAPEEEPRTRDRSSPSLRRQRYTAQEEESKTPQNVQEEEVKSLAGRSSPSVCSTGSAAKASMRHKARMRRRRQSAAQSAGASVGEPQEASSLIQTPAPVAEDISTGSLERDLSPEPSDTISQTSAISSTLSPRSTFRHRRRMEVRGRLRQEAGN